MGPKSAAVRREIARYLSGEQTIVEFYEVVAAAFAVAPINDPDASVVAETYGLLVEHHAGHLGDSELRDTLHPLVTAYRMNWGLMSEPSLAATGADSDYVATPAPMPVPSWTVFEISPVAARE
jgi:hypothetical protein